MSPQTKGKEQAPVTLKTSLEKNQQSLGGGGGKKWLKEPNTKEKLKAPMNHMIDVASYWVCACQRPLTSGT